jgi:hypothetical protein
MSPRSGCSLVLACALLTAVAAAQSGPLSASAPTPSACPLLSAEEVVANLVRRNRERAQALPAYRSTRTYRTVYRGFPSSRTAEMVVDVTFEPPGTKTFTIRSQTGSKLIIDRVFKKLLESEQEAADAENQKKTALNGHNYLFALTGCEMVAGDLMFVLTVEPRIKAKYLYRGQIWVDAADFAVTRISAEPAKNPSFWIKQTQIEQLYSKVKDFWLPASNRSSTSVRLGGHADFSIEYKDYQLASVPPAVMDLARSNGQR